MGAGNSTETPIVESGYGGRYWERDYDTLSKKYWDALEQLQILNIQLGALRTELRNLKAEQAASAADTVPLKDWNRLVADYDKLDEKLELQKKSTSGSHLRWNQEKQAHLEKMRQLNADLFTLREVEIPHLKRLQAQKSQRSIQEKELLTSEKVVIYQYNRTKIVIENIPFDYSQEEVIDKFLGKGQHLIYWDDNWLPENVTDATLLLFLPSSEPGYEMKNGRPHTERLRTDKGIIGFIFFETVGKAQACMRMFSKYRPPGLPYGFSYYGNAAHINTLLHKHLSF
ncbi:unnamed protein product, partial [Mesorhabditis spiculigera]